MVKGPVSGEESRESRAGELVHRRRGFAGWLRATLIDRHHMSPHLCLRCLERAPVPVAGPGLRVHCSSGLVDALSLIPPAFFGEYALRQNLGRSGLDSESGWLQWFEGYPRP